MRERVDLRLLGPLEVCIDGRTVSLGGRRQQAVLACLLLAHPNPVSTDALTEALWSDGPPPTSATTLQAYLSRLRRVLGPAGVRLVSGGRSYRLEVEDGVLDVHRFDSGVDHGMALVGECRFGEAVAVLEPSLALWRTARVLGMFHDEAWVAAEATRLTERRVVAIELLADAHLALGENLPVLTLLDAAVSEHPLAESLVMRLMLARYRAGRQSEALAAYSHCRRELHLELGLEPSPELQRLQQAILNQDPSLDWHPPVERQPPRVLPPPNPLFVGRDDDLSTIQGLLHDNDVVTLYGLGGVGKTEAARELAHRHDGPVAWVAAETRTSLFSGLTSLARRLGISAAAEETQLRDSLWQAMRRFEGWLVVYDNAVDIELVRHFLPPAPACALLITSQSQSWRALGPTVRVDPFDTGVAAAYVLRRSGRRDFNAAEKLAELLGNLPLALEQASAYVDETGLSLPEYLRLFHGRRDQMLARGAPAGHRDAVTTTWRLAFDRVRARSPLAARILELLAFLSPDAAELSLLAPLVPAGEDHELAAADAIGELLRYSLVDREDGILRVHRLVQTVVRARLSGPEALERATAATELLAQAAPDEPTMPDSWPSWASLAPHVSALITAAHGVAALPPRLIPLAMETVRYLRARSALPSAHSVLDALIEFARSLPEDAVLLARLHAERGDLLDAEGQLELARHELEHALTLFGPVTDHNQLAVAHTWVRLARVLNCADQPIPAIGYYHRGLAVLRAAGDVAESVRALIGLGYAYWSIDDFESGAEQFRQALAALDRAGWSRHPFAPEALGGLGMMLHELGRLDEARRLQEQALDALLAIHGRIDHPVIAETRDKLGWVLRLLGESEASRTEHALAVRILEGLFGPQDPRFAMALTNLALAELEVGDLESAVANQRRSRAVLVQAYGPDHRHSRLVTVRLHEAERAAVTTFG